MLKHFNAQPSVGIKTTGYMYGQPTHMFTKIDMYRRNPTNTPGQTNVKFGRPAEGYYTQKYPGGYPSSEKRLAQVTIS